MSILLIGQNSSVHPRSVWAPNQYRQRTSKMKKIKQMYYRRALEEQIEIKKLKTKRQKQLQAWQDHLRQQELHKHIWLKQTQQPQLSINHQPILQTKRYRKNLQSFENPSFNKSQQMSLPSIYKRNTFQTEYQRSYLPVPFVKYQLNDMDYHGHRKLKSQNDQYIHKSRHNSRIKTQSNPQQKRKQLSKNSDRKIKEVYKMIDSSIDTYRNAQIYTPQKSIKNVSFKLPNNQIKSNTQNYRNQFSNYSQFYSLPYKSTQIPLDDQYSSQQLDWRAWYARQKLRQLQQYMKSQKMNNYINNRFLNHKKDNSIQSRPKWID